MNDYDINLYILNIDKITFDFQIQNTKGKMIYKTPINIKISEFSSAFME